MHTVQDNPPDSSWMQPANAVCTPASLPTWTQSTCAYSVCTNVTLSGTGVLCGTYCVWHLLITATTS